MFGEERAGEVNQIGDDLVIGIRPLAGEFKGVAGLLLLVRIAEILDMVEPGRVGIVLRVRPIGDDKNLHEFI